MVEFIDTGLCLTEGRLAKMRPDLKADPVKDDAMLANMKSKLENFILVTDYVGKQNCLIPIGMMFGHELAGTGIPIPEPVIFENSPTSQEFISVIRSLAFGSQFKYVNCDITFLIQTHETDQHKIPMIAFEVLGPDGVKEGWDGLPLFEPGEYRAGEWNKVRFRRNIDLSYIRDIQHCTLKLYLWNRDKLTLRCDSLVTQITGYN